MRRADVIGMRMSLSWWRSCRHGDRTSEGDVASVTQRVSARRNIRSVDRPPRCSAGRPCSEDHVGFARCHRRRCSHSAQLPTEIRHYFTQYRSDTTYETDSDEQQFTFGSAAKPGANVESIRMVGCFHRLLTNRSARSRFEQITTQWPIGRTIRNFPLARHRSRRVASRCPTVRSTRPGRRSRAHRLPSS